MEKNKPESTEDKKYNEAQLASEWNHKFMIAMVHKAPYTKLWTTYKDAYKGDYFKNETLPEYKSDLVSNYIFSIVETIRPIMLDNDPKFQALPRNGEGLNYASDVNEALMYEWDREKINRKLYKELINVLTIGTAIFFVPWSSDKKNVKPIAINPFNLFPDPLATCVEDAEHIIYASYINVNKLKRAYPKHASRLTGGSINYSELVNDNDMNARIDNQILVLEVWVMDFELNDAGTLKYPKGRVLTICPDLGIVLDDKSNVYSDGEMPFILFKNYDVPGKFWGEGEVAQLISPQKYMNELNNAVLDNAKATANMPWIVDKNSGVPYGQISARPGLVIRKNPGTEVRREQPPSMPAYIVNAIETYKGDMEMISGVHNTLRGENATGVYTAQGILALQEAGLIRIRLKVKLLEISLGEFGVKWFSRMKQFWKEDRWISIVKSDGSYDMKKFNKDILDYDYDIKITAGSTMPVNRGAMLDLMIRLAQTPMPDGQNLVDRESVTEYLPEEIKSALLKRMKEKSNNLAEVEQAVQQLGQMLQETSQQLAQALDEVANKSDSNDADTFSVIEDITKAIEALQKQTQEMTNRNEQMEKDMKEQEKIDKIKKQSYNKGYKDSESVMKGEDTISKGKGIGEEEMQAPTGQVNTDQGTALPDEILAGIEQMSDEELQVLMESNPQLLDLLK